VNERTPVPDDAAVGAAIVAVILVLALIDGVWLLAIPAAVVVALVALALM
jgi:hypothetical protein